MAWRKNTAFVWVLPAILAAAQAVAAPNTQAAIAQAGAALDQGNTSQVITLADTALAASATPLERGRLLLDRGVAHELDGADQEALADFTAAIATHALPAQERAQALLQRGFLRDAMGRLDEAGGDYGMAAALGTAVSSTALNNRGNIYRRQHRLEDARRDYMAALAAGSAKPQYPYYGLGQIAEARHDIAAARGFYARAVAADPGYQLAVDRLAAVGGAQDATPADPEVVVLHPPLPLDAHASDPVLRPPPQRRAAPVPTTRHIIQTPGSGPGLRPALDGPMGGGAQAQLGAWRSEAEVQAAWARARTKTASLLDGMTPRIVSADIPARGRFFRLRVAVADPSTFCRKLKTYGVDCLTVPHEELVVRARP